MSKRLGTYPKGVLILQSRRRSRAHASKAAGSTTSGWTPQRSTSGLQFCTTLAAAMWLHPFLAICMRTPGVEGGGTRWGKPGYWHALYVLSH